MCGIAGVIERAGRRPDESKLRRLVNSLHHRGPDTNGMLVAGAIGFAHTRLSILDLSESGNQPMKSARSALVFNGEIYNYRVLREKLAKSGIEVRGSSDTAVLFACLEEWGVERTLPELEGMFAFAFADLETSRVWLCRDRLGIKPLVWAERDGAVYFASEASALARALGLGVDALRTLSSLHGSFESLASQTCFVAVRQVDAGGVLVCDPDCAPKHSHWFRLQDLVDESRYRELDSLPFELIAEEFARLLRESVDKMLMSDVPVGAFVSGGVDSSLISAFAAKSSSSLRLFTADVRGAYSEVDKARAVASHIGRQLHEEAFDPSDFLPGWVQQTASYDLPIVTFTNAVPFAKVAKAASSAGIKPVVTGEGADELFMGYPELLRNRYLAVARAPVSGLTKLYGAISPALAEWMIPTAGGRPFLVRLAQAFDMERSTPPVEDAYPFLSRRAGERAMHSLRMTRVHLRGLLHRNDRMGMQASIESRFPFLDEAIVSFALNLPPKHKARVVRRVYDKKHPFLMDKAPVRHAAIAALPAHVALATKEGFPMYGHKFVRLTSSFFSGGWVAETVGLRDDDMHDLVESTDDYTLAKLASVEIFGRIFGHGLPWQDVFEALAPHMSLATPDTALPPPG